MAMPAPRFRSSLGSSFIRYIADHNPFYLLSAALMLLACLLLGNTMTWSPIGAGRILTLIAVLNVYEVLLVALGLYLITRRKLLRDGVMLLVFEAFFVVDVGFLNSEVYQQNQTLGELTNAILAVVIFAKLWIIFRALGLRIGSGQFVVTLAEVATLLFLPGVLKRLSVDHSGMLHPPAMYVSWWLVGLLIGGAAVVTRFGRPQLAGTALAKAAHGLANVFLILPLVSLIAHLGTTHWVFQVPFQAFDMTPLMLGAAMLMVSIPAKSLAARRDLLVLGAIFIFTGTACGLSQESRLVFPLGPYAISTAGITAVAAYVVTVYCFVLSYAMYMLPLGAAVATAYLVGPSRGTIIEDITAMTNWLSDVAQRLMPKTQREWGVTAMISSFLLLIVGAWLSLFRGSVPVEPLNKPTTPVVPPPLTPLK